MSNKITNIRLSDGADAVIILDQTLLPGETKYLTLQTPQQMFEAICSLRVRGAPAIGIFAAYALYVLAASLKTPDLEEFIAQIKKYGDFLKSSRPTAVNLETQLRRMISLVNRIAMEESQTSEGTKQTILDAMKNEADSIYAEDVNMCRAISEHGLTLIKDGFGIMTQCNAGPIATSQYGTGLGPIILGHEQGLNLNVHICETRPLLQGARLTSYELSCLGIDCTLICDNMASIVMSEGKINAVFTGADRIAANGDVANKVGTSALAILAKYYDIPFYVFAPSTTLDPGCPAGADIEIELRDPGEIKEMFFSKPVAPFDVKCYNPAFDITPNHLITAIITEKGKYT